MSGGQPSQSAPGGRLPAPRPLETVLADVKAALLDELGQDLIALYLYGSAVGGGYMAGASNINVLLVCQALGTPVLDRLVPHFQKFSADWVNCHVQTPEELRDAADVFPLNLIELCEHRRLLHGEDLLASVQADPDKIRHQVEFELRHLLRRARTAYLRAEGSRPQQCAIIRTTFRKYIYALRGLLRLRGKCPGTLERGPVIALARDELKLDGALLERLHAFKERRGGPVRPAEIPKLLDGLMGLLADTARLADRMVGRID